MSLLALLENSKQVALDAREEVARKNAEEIAEFEEYGADMAAALDEQELAAAEEALRLGLELDEREDEEQSEREKADVALAQRMLREEEENVAACEKDEALARQLEEQLKVEAVRVAKLEKRERQLAQRKLCKGDLQAAEQLAFEIEEEEYQLQQVERRDRRLAQQLVKQESKALASMPQTEEKLKELSKAINGDGPMSMRMRMRAKLSSMRLRMKDITNSVDSNAGTERLPF